MRVEVSSRIVVHLPATQQPHMADEDPLSGHYSDTRRSRSVTHQNPPNTHVPDVNAVPLSGVLSLREPGIWGVSYPMAAVALIASIGVTSGGIPHETEPCGRGRRADGWGRSPSARRRRHPRAVR